MDDHDICFPLSPDCRVEIRGTVTGAVCDRLVELAEFCRKHLCSSAAPSGVLVEFATMKPMQPAAKLPAIPKPTQAKPVGLQGDVDAEVRERNLASRWDLYRARAVDYLRKAGRPVARVQLLRECGIPQGSGSGVLDDKRFRSFEHAGVWKVTLSAPAKPPEDLDPNITTDLDELSDEQRAKYREIQQRKELERREGK